MFCSESNNEIVFVFDGMKRCLFLFIGEVNVTTNIDNTPIKQSIDKKNNEYFRGFFKEKSNRLT